MTKRIPVFLLILILVVVASVVYAQQYCPYCGRGGYSNPVTYSTQTYNTPCAHHPNGYDTHNVKYMIRKGICDFGGTVKEEWIEQSHSVTCHGWAEGDVNCLP